MRRIHAVHVVVPLIALLSAVALLGAGVAAPPDDAAARLAGRALGKTPLLGDVRELCDRVGGRPTGSPACARAIDWGTAKFREIGIPVTTESFAVPNLWLGGQAEAAALAPEAFPLRVVACPQTASTPGGKPIEARLVDAGKGTPEDFARLGASAKGAVALVQSHEMKSFDDLDGDYSRNAVWSAAAERAGVTAVLLQSAQPRGLLSRHPIALNGTLLTLPVAMVGREQGGRLARLAAAGEVRVRLAISNEIGAGYESSNVVAEIAGREKPGEIVVIGAHLDSWDLGTGANDNGVNVGLVIDTARALKELGLVPRRTVRFVLFTGEEQGMFGSLGYVRRHAAELDRHVGVVIFDTGSGRTSGFSLGGREELRKIAEEALVPVAALGPFAHTNDAIDGTDNFDFVLAGVPNFVANQDAGPYTPDYHAESDTFEMVDGPAAQANAAIAAALVWRLAEAPERAARQNRSEVDALLVKTKLADQMKALGQWQPWLRGERGPGD
jgi:Zn-dependent M28 family amino/carboxypeptidase